METTKTADTRAKGDPLKPGHLDRDLEQNIAKDFELTKAAKEREVIDKQIKEGAEQYDNFRKLGFATENDIEARFNELKVKHEQELTEMRQFVEQRTKTTPQGQNSGMLDDMGKKKEKNPLILWEK